MFYFQKVADSGVNHESVTSTIMGLTDMKIMKWEEKLSTYAFQERSQLSDEPFGSVEIWGVRTREFMQL